MTRRRVSISTDAALALRVVGYLVLWVTVCVVVLPGSDVPDHGDHAGEAQAMQLAAQVVLGVLLAPAFVLLALAVEAGLRRRRLRRAAADHEAARLEALARTTSRSGSTSGRP